MRAVRHETEVDVKEPPCGLSVVHAVGAMHRALGLNARSPPEVQVFGQLENVGVPVLFSWGFYDPRSPLLEKDLCHFQRPQGAGCPSLHCLTFFLRQVFIAIDVLANAP